LLLQASSRFVIAFAPLMPAANNAHQSAVQPSSAGCASNIANAFSPHGQEMFDGLKPVAMVNYRFEAGYTGEPAL